MKLGLCVFFNYPFERNVPIWQELYGDVFDEIKFIQPFIKSDNPDIWTVYRPAFNFGGFFADCYEKLAEMDVDAIIFVGDDCIINPTMFGETFEEQFKFNDDFAAMIPQFVPFANDNWWRNTHKISTIGRLLGDYGIYDQRVEGWRNFLPDADTLTPRLTAYRIDDTVLRKPAPEDAETLTDAQNEIIRRLFQDKTEVEIPYPLAYAVSDFFIVKKSYLEAFCHNVGMFAAMNIFPEVAVPTALMALDGRVRVAGGCGVKFNWTFGRNEKAEHFLPESIEEVRDFIDDMDPRLLFVHPVKLSKVAL